MHADDSYGDISVTMQDATFQSNSERFADLVADQRTNTESDAKIFSDTTMPVCVLNGDARSISNYRCAKDDSLALEDAPTSLLTAEDPWLLKVQEVCCL